MSGPASIQAANPATVSWVIVMTGIDGQQHYVTDDVVASGRRSGRYVGVCGREIIPASLTAPEGTACRSCALWADATDSAENYDRDGKRQHCHPDRGRGRCSFVRR